MFNWIRRRRKYVSREEFRAATAGLNERMESVEASQAQNQAQIDAEATRVSALGEGLDTIKSEVDALKAAHAAGQALDFSALDAALDDTSSRVSADVAEAAPDPAPGPTPGPTPAAADATQPVYTYSGDVSAVNASVWTPTGLETAEATPRTLYYFAQDTPNSGQGGQATGNLADNGAWQVWTGAVQAAA